MTRISSSEQILLLLKERLQRMERGRSGRSARTSAKREPTGPPVARLQALPDLDQIPAEELQRSLVRALLGQELGEAITNDPSFQSVSDEVLRLIKDSEEGRSLIDRATLELRVRG